MTDNIYNLLQEANREILNITKIRSMCSVKGKKIKNIPIEINEDKNEAILYVPNTQNLKRSIASLKKKKEFDIIVDKDYVYRHVFLIRIETKLPENIIFVTVGLNGYTYQKKTKVNMATVDLDSFIDLSHSIATVPGCVEFLLDNYKFRITIGDKKIYIYSYKKLQEKDFLKYFQAIKLALGFTTGVFIGGKVYVFSVQTFLGKFKRINYLRCLLATSEKKLSIDTFINNFYPLTEELKKRDSSGKTQLTDIQLGNLCDLIYNDEQISTALHYLSQSELEGQNLEHQLVLLACAYEAVTKNLRNKEQCRLMDKCYFRKFLREIKPLIKEKIEELNIENKENIANKLQNQLKNQISNHDKLMLPITKYNLTISQEEDTLLENRNHMFHGDSFVYKENIEQSVIEFQKEKYLYYFLIYAIILKMIRYNGYIIDARQWNEIIKYSHDAKTFPYQDNFIYNLGNSKTSEQESE